MMITLPTPFIVPVLIFGEIRPALLYCVFEDGNVLVKINDIKYHCIVGTDKMLTLADNGEEKYLRETAIEGITYLPGKE